MCYSYGHMAVASLIASGALLVNPAIPAAQAQIPQPPAVERGAAEAPILRAQARSGVDPAFQRELASLDSLLQDIAPKAAGRIEADQVFVVKDLDKSLELYAAGMRAASERPATNAEGRAFRRLAQEHAARLQALDHPPARRLARELTQMAR